MATDSTLDETPPALSNADEFANSVTHGGGILLSLVGAGFMLPAAQSSGGGVQLASLAYLLSLVAVYVLSTLSHVVQSEAQRNRMRAWDQGAIYFLIVGTYTPFVAAFLPGMHAMLIVSAMWLAAGVGFWSKVVAKHRVNAMSTWSYIALGWLPALALAGHVPFDCVVWMAIGGISYTGGIVFLVLDHRVKYFHAIWHIMVIAASACHYYAIMKYVVT